MRPALDLKRALRVYVLGHDAGYDIATKLRMAEGELETERLAAGAAAGLDPATSASAGERGVPVPEQLDFHRSAGTWRELIPGLPRGA